jgi:hypothetical protein
MQGGVKGGSPCRRPVLPRKLNLSHGPAFAIEDVQVSAAGAVDGAGQGRVGFNEVFKYKGSIW